MESFDAEGEDKRGGQVLSTELHTKVVEAFEQIGGRLGLGLADARKFDSVCTIK